MKLAIVQLSIAVGAVQVTTAEHAEAFVLVVISEGHPLITGAVLSLTITFNEQVDVFPLVSVAV